MWTYYENNDIEFLFQVVKCTHNFYWNRPKKGLLSPDIRTLISYLTLIQLNTTLTELNSDSKKLHLITRLNLMHYQKNYISVWNNS